MAENKSCETKNTDELIGGVFDFVDSGVLIIDADFNVLTANEPAKVILGRQGSVISSMSVRDIFGAAYANIDWLLSVVMRTGQSRKSAFSFDVAPENVRYVSASVSMIDNGPAGMILVMTLTDITEQQQALVKNAQTEKMAAVGLLAAGIAHEFNNIWASVQGYAELAKQNPGFMKELTDVCLEQSERASEIIHALLSFSDMRVDLRHGVRLGRILKSIKRLVSLEMQAKGIELSLEIAEDPVISGNESMLQQIFLNLVINAYQAILDKGLVGIWIGEDDGWVVVRVRDTGVGMSKEQIRRLFEPFYTTKGALGGNERVDGHGLGLTLTYNLVRLHGGDISIESETGKGSVFTVRFPKIGDVK
ncbi:MAG: hypothetical protein JXR97_09480, partial [Planctomycetes bacterium]|nr:hypothetical protein [Planctomycetota bacterium]